MTRSRFRSRRDLTILAGWKRHDGKGCPVYPASHPKIQLRYGTRTSGSGPASEWIDMAEGSAWEWEGQREQPFDIVVYLPEYGVVRLQKRRLD